MKALIFGSIGTLAETSHLQRKAFNDAFAAHGLNWNWDEDTYATLLRRAGGRDRIARFAQAQGETVDAASLHKLKSRLFQQALARGVSLRPGVAETLALARARGWRLALATSTSAANVDAVLSATGLTRADFATVLDATHALPAKPAPDVFHAALAALDLQAQDALAIEDNPDGFHAARAAGLACLAVPGALHATADFSGAYARQTTLDLSGITL
ncbi:MAG: HAD-IA family hydrolase [Alphaproteobacteria bacterium]|jgi:HAD superfamily hydrolase (TIGR01509 family)|nr:HAD-IA family hydrolase [Alphaproteobacteria bacterium]